MVRTSWLVRLVLTLVTAIKQVRIGADVCDTRKRKEKMGCTESPY
jgi:hypothetical protein